MSESYLFFLELDLDMLFFLRAYLLGRSREFDGNNFLGVVLKLLILCVKCVY